MSWWFLTAAILLEVVGTSFMKAAQGMTKALPVFLMFACYAGSISMLSLALKQIDLGIAYAIWAGLGTAIVAVIGVLAFGEPMSFAKIICLLLIIAGVVGLNIAK